MWVWPDCSSACMCESHTCTLSHARSHLWAAWLEGRRSSCPWTWMFPTWNQSCFSMQGLPHFSVSLNAPPTKLNCRQKSSYLLCFFLSFLRFRDELFITIKQTAWFLSVLQKIPLVERFNGNPVFPKDSMDGNVEVNIPTSSFCCLTQTFLLLHLLFLSHIGGHVGRSCAEGHPEDPSLLFWRSSQTDLCWWGFCPQRFTAGFLFHQEKLEASRWAEWAFSWWSPSLNGFWLTPVESVCNPPSVVIWTGFSSGVFLKNSLRFHFFPSGVELEVFVGFFLPARRFAILCAF